MKPWSYLRRQVATTIGIAVCIIAAGATVAPPAGADDATMQIARARAGGNGQTLTDDGATHVQPAWSPDGSRIAYDANPDGFYHLFVMNADGSNQTQLTAGSWNDVQPAWSPDGSRIAFASNRGGTYDIYTMAAEGSDVQPVTSNSANDVQPTWSPDGARIGFASNRRGDWDVFTIATDGHGVAQLTFIAASDVQPAWSPDGATMAFASNRGGSKDVYTIAAQGGPVRQLTSSLASDSAPAWSRDGATLAFSSNRSGLPQVYSMPSTGGALEQATDGATMDAQPSWKPTGDALTFSQLAAPAPADVFWGIYSAPRNGMSSGEVTRQLEGEIGRDFTGQRIYQNMTTARVPTPDMERLASIGGYIYLNINSFTRVNGRSVCALWADVAAGRYDGRWAQIAQEIKNFGYLIHLGYHHEMTNDSVHHPVCGTAADYRRAYNHLHDLFTRLGVTNVQWVWAPTASAFNLGVAWRYQPSHYDVLGVDGYSRTSGWRTPAQIFVTAHRFAMAHDKALLIGEVGCDEYPRSPMRKALWIQSAAGMFHGWSDLQAVLWTNTGAKNYRFWLDSSRPSITLFTMAGAQFK
jgi:Tol biopolymer transport system component